MNRLGEKSLKTLEYYEILEQLAAQADSEAGKEKCRALRPLDDHEQAALWLRQTSDAKNQMIRQGSPSFGGLRNLGAILARAERGGTLNPPELLSVASVLQTVRRALLYDAEHEEKIEKTGKNTLAPLFGLLTGNRSLEEAITTAILSEEEIADGASSELLSIRREMRRVAGKVRETLGRLISGERSKYLQEAIVTQRGGRYVVPVKAEHRSDVPGLVHDTSSTGATIFVEPAAVVEINNQLKLLESREEAEIERILADLTGQVAQSRASIEQDCDVLATLDFIFARARLSFAMNGAEPILRPDTCRCRFIRARHPLLDKTKAVPIDIAIGGEYDTLVITGPNTGGKTVSLKTVGLLSLMAASGLHIPANEQSEIGLFQHVYADIGDEQSIEQSLSTFSAHMKTIVSIMNCCEQGDLVLFDELGAGTDPVEGAALAVAIIGYARQMGACVAATTHYAELKTFALTTEGVENASCEFDVKSLQPTYRLLTGIPGKSNAFAIAGRLGLSPTIIDRAKQQVSTEDARFEDVLAELERERRRIEQLKDEAARMRSAAQSERDKMRAERDAAEQRADKMMETARNQADRILKEARMTAETVFDELEELKKQSQKNVAEQNLAAAKAALRGVITQTENEQRRGMNKRTVDLAEQRPVQKGDQVRLLNMAGITATVLAPAGREGTIQVQAGAMKLTIKENEVRLIETTSSSSSSGKATGSAPQRYQPRRDAPNRELSLRSVETSVDVRGMSAEEAILEVDNFLSGALMAGLPSVMIIHGKGTGVLRQAIQSHLRGKKQIKSVRSGVYGEGEQGVTIVEIG